MKASGQKSFWALRSSDDFREIENRAVRVRKLLRQLSQGKDREVRRVMDDAAKLAKAIEQLARYGQTCSAEDLVDVEVLIEEFSLRLDDEVDRIFAS